MAVQQIAPVICPNCRTQFTAPVENIIDGQDPAKKSALLQGQLNLVQCPQCRTVFTALVPVLYYDLEKELAFVLVPPELHLSGPAQEKTIGSLTNTLINQLPTEQRKFYLFNPKLFLSLESLIKAILEAEGITEEVLQAQAARVKLIEEFLQSPDEATLKEKVKAHEAELDEDFFEVLTFYMQAAQMSGDQARAQTFFALRSLLGKWSSRAKAAIDKIDAELGLVVIQNQKDLLERLIGAKDNREREALIANGHSMLDYTFFQQLTSQIDEAAKKGEVQTTRQLKDLRTFILDTKAKHEEQNRVALEKAVNLLKAILQSNQPDKILQERLEEIDEAFFFVLKTNIEQARRQGQEEAAKTLEMLGNMAMAMLQEADQPEEVEEQPAKPEPPSPQIHIASR
jgi:hypothetical protein